MPKRSVLFFAFGTGFFLFFILFSFLVHKDIFTQVDFDTTVRLQNNISQRFDEIFSWFSELGKFEPTVVLLVILLALWKKILVGLTLFSGFVAFHVIELFGKYFVDHPPPPEFMLRTKQLVDFPQFHVRAEFSYPSGHSGRTLFLAVLVVFLIWQTKLLPRWGKVGLSGLVCSFVLVMLVSRIYLGEHWLTDVIGGGILGLALSLIGLAFYRKKRFTSITYHKTVKQASV